MRDYLFNPSGELLVCQLLAPGLYLFLYTLPKLYNVDAQVGRSTAPGGGARETAALLTVLNSKLNLLLIVDTVWNKSRQLMQDMAICILYV